MPEPSKAFGRTHFENQLAGQTGKKNYLLAIAIDQYEYLPRLYNAVRDVTAFVTLLQEKYQFFPEYTTLLCNQEATRKNIYRAVDRLVQVITPEDNLVVYFSGHGEFRDQMDEGYWIPVDAEREAFFDFIPNQQIQHYLKRINSLHSFVIVDSCFSGTLFTSRNVVPTERLKTVPSRWLLTSGRKELVSDGKPGDHSPFAENILLFLRQNQQPSLPISRLIDDVVHATAANAKQTPRGEPIQDTGHKGGQFYFHLKQNEAGDWAVAQQKNTIDAYTHFLAMYPVGQFHQQAKAALTREAEEKAWLTAIEENNVLALLDFREQFPQSSHVISNEVDDRIADLEEEQLWLEATRSGIASGYLLYLRQSRLGKYRLEANEKIAGFRRVEEETKQKEEEARDAQRSMEAEETKRKEQEKKEAETREALRRFEEVAKRKSERLEAEASEAKPRNEAEDASRNEAEIRVQKEAEQNIIIQESHTPKEKNAGAVPSSHVHLFPLNQLKLPLGVGLFMIVIIIVIWQLVGPSKKPVEGLGGPFSEVEFKDVLRLPLLSGQIPRLTCTIKNSPDSRRISSPKAKGITSWRSPATITKESPNPKGLKTWGLPEPNNSRRFLSLREFPLTGYRSGQGCRTKREA